MNNTYFATTTAGLESVAWQDISRHYGPLLLELAHRRIAFAYNGPPQALLALRSVDDVFATAGDLAGIDHTRAALAVLREQVAALDLAGALQRCREVQPLPDQPRFAVTASFVGARNYSRYDLADAVAAGVRARHPWPSVPNTPEEHGEHDLHLRLLLEGERGLLGARLAEQPLHRRSYKQASRPGSLKAPVAYCMALLAGVAAGFTVLDPLCGAGTLAIEAAALARPGLVLASDRSPAAVADARANAEGSSYVPLLVADATALPLPAASVDALVSNLPFGRQVQPPGGVAPIYAGALAECARVLRPGRNAALLTDQGRALMDAARITPDLRLVGAHQISLFGLHPIIYLFERRS
jgi:23S rRNA G2445 N2-methylase RlmL